VPGEAADLLIFQYRRLIPGLSDQRVSDRGGDYPRAPDEQAGYVGRHE
jgi:hypothetical protein